MGVAASESDFARIGEVAGIGAHAAIDPLFRNGPSSGAASGTSGRSATSGS